MWEFWRGKLAKGRSSPRSTASPGGAAAPGADATSSRRSPAVVNFKDLNLSVDDELSEDAAHPDEDPTNKVSIRAGVMRSGAQKNKLIIIMVGLPGRGKTFLCNKLKCYLNWLGHNTAHFNVGNYRRLQKDPKEVQDASFFDCHNKHGVEARCRALMAAIDDVSGFLAGGGQVAIFDATNTTRERRQLLINTFHGRCQYIFIESICNDSQVLEDNYRYKMKFSPDYQGVDTEAALEDFKKRIVKYNQVYEPIDDRRLHYIKLIDMVTGRGYMDVNRISGYIPGKIVFFLMQVCKAGMTAGQSRKIWLTRHGESQFNMAGRIGGDSLLTPRGEEYARLLPDVLDSRLPATFNESGVPVSIWTSTLRRTIATAAHLPYPKLRWKALDEIHAGVCDGLTYSQIAERFPEDYEARKRDKLRYRYPSGESYLDVVQRLEPVIIEMEREREFVMVVGHQAILRAIFGYFMAVPLEKIPRLDIPLHTLIELSPRPDGTMEVAFMPVPVGGPGEPGSSPSRQRHPGFNPHHPLLQRGFGSSPPPASPPAALTTFGSLPAGFLNSYGGSRAGSFLSSPPAAAAAGAAAGPGSSPPPSGGSSGGRAHRRSASMTSMTSFGVMRPVTSFATISSMASLAGSSSGSGGGGGGSSGNLAAVADVDASDGRIGGSSSGGSGGDGGNVTSQMTSMTLMQPQFSLSAWNQQAEAAAAAADSYMGAATPEGSFSGPCGSSDVAAAAVAAGEGGEAAPPPPLDPSVAAELQLQGLALEESVALTSGVVHSPAAAAAGGSSERQQQQRLAPLKPSGGSSSSAGSSSAGSGQVASPVLNPAISSMNSLD